MTIHAIGEYIPGELSLCNHVCVVTSEFLSDFSLSPAVVTYCVLMSHGVHRSACMVLNVDVMVDITTHT